MTDATFTTTCARCAAPLEVTDATVDAVSKAHEATCIIPGDEVRWDYAGNWIEGKPDSIIEKSFGSIAHIDVVGTSFNNPVRRRSVGLGGSATFRRIPRPEPVVAPKWVPTEGYPRPVAKLHDHLVGYLATTKTASPDSETSFACPACGRAYDGSDESSVAHRKGCGRYDAYVAWLTKPANRRGLDVEHPVAPTPTSHHDPAPPDSEAERQTFIPGDVAEWRLDGLTWERVTVVRAYPDDKFEIEHHRTASRWQVHRSELRRVARQEQAVDALDVLYDCETLRSLLVLDEANRRGEGEVRPDGKPWKFTPIQRAAVSAHWSAQLRSRIAASSERARLTVIAPELETANCKDAE